MTEERYPQGARVEMAAHTDAWARGDRYGTVVTVEPNGMRRVLLDRSGKVVRFFVDDIRREMRSEPDWEARARYLERALNDIAAAVGLDPENATTHQVVTAVRNAVAETEEGRRQ